MNSSQIALIAERMGWASLYKIAYENESKVVMASIINNEWHLTSSGAWECMIEMKLDFAHEEFNGSVQWGACFGDDEIFVNENPVEAISLAALAMIEEEG